MKERSKRLNKARKHHHRAKFNENDPQYKCCFKRLHIMVAIVVVAAVELFGIIVLTGSLVYAVAAGHSLGINKDIAFGLIGNAIAVAIILLMGYGIKKEKPILLIPHMVVQILGIVALYLGCLLMIVALATDEHDIITLFYDYNQYENKDLRDKFVFFLIPMIVGLFVAASLEVWFLFLVYQCYKYLSDLVHSKTNKSDHYVQLQHVTATKPDDKNVSGEGDKSPKIEGDKSPKIEIDKSPKSEVDKSPKTDHETHLAVPDKNTQTSPSSGTTSDQKSEQPEKSPKPAKKYVKSGHSSKTRPIKIDHSKDDKNEPVKLAAEQHQSDSPKLENIKADQKVPVIKLNNTDTQAKSGTVAKTKPPTTTSDIKVEKKDQLSTSTKSDEKTPLV